jgi:hypothetical protein
MGTSLYGESHIQRHISRKWAFLSANRMGNTAVHEALIETARVFHFHKYILSSNRYHDVTVFLKQSLASPAGHMTICQDSV